MNTNIEEYVIDINDDIYKAHWKLHRNGRILIVKSGDRFEGVISFKEISKTYNNPELTISDICNRKCKYLTGDDIYQKAKIIYADNVTIRDLPIVGANGSVEGILSREQVFWKQYYKECRLPRMHYAYCIYNAAFEAKALGYDSISIIEFGVAGGNGLVNCEFHAHEIERILGIKIEIYGFDSAEGLPVGNMGYKDMIHIWPDCSYKMDRELLEKRLTDSKLVLGQFKETTVSFFEQYKPSPIGCILVDVDRYSSTLPIFDMFYSDVVNFLPRVYMYFDDITPSYEFQGEVLAIKEFNQKNEYMKISPEIAYAEPEYRKKVKTLHFFKHEKYNDPTMMYDGWEINADNLELPLSASRF